MRSVYFILMVLTLSCSSCVVKPISEIRETKNLLNQVKESTQSEEAGTERQSLVREEEIAQELINQIDKKNSEQLTNHCKQLLSICSQLIQLLDTSVVSLENRHGRDENGKLINWNELIYVNQIFITEGRGELIKTEILHSINMILEVLNHYETTIEKEDLPLKLHIEIEEKGISWEEYMFKDMPARAIVPILKKFRNDVVLTRILILEELLKQYKPENN